MDFKLLRGKTTELNFTDNRLMITQPTFLTNDVEFCFQFDNEEPIGFASGSNDLHIHISPTPNGNIIFTNNNGRTFKIFARERQ